MAIPLADAARCGVAVGLLVAACSTAPTVPTSARTVVPMQILNTMTLVSVHVNDSPYHALFLVDTGANLTVLTPLFAQRLGIAVPDNARRRNLRAVGGGALSIPLVRITRLAVGDAFIENIDVGVYEAFPQTRSIDGILGADFLHRFNVTLDRTNGRMLLEPLAR